MATLVVLLSLFFQAVTSQSTPVSIATVATAVPSPSAPLASLLPSQVPPPPAQAWCPSEIFCPGSVLQTVGIANVYPDDKTFVDKPTSKRSQAVLADFQNISSSTTYSEIVNFLDGDFDGEGKELEAVALPSDFNASPPFLNNITSPLAKAFALVVHEFWPQLIRSTNASTLCGNSGRCESTLIPLNHTFVVPGGRFREQYYWDSFWIVEGLIQSQLYSVVNGTLQNFMDELELFGFIPNGGRIYYLDRSQPPLFTQMLSNYVKASGDRSILTRALPLAEKEFQWWNTNRSVQVKSPFSGTTFTMYHYNVTNSGPRPESYLTDYLTANDPTLQPALTDSQKADLYAELASGGETGWDFSMRWFSGSPSKVGGLVSLNIRNIVGPDLNGILYMNHLALADLYGSSNTTAANLHTTAAASLKAGILDLLWDSQKLGFYDFILNTNNRSDIFSAAAFYPFWGGIIPEQVANDESSAFGAFASINMVMNRYNGTFPATFVETGLQWDAPNAWAPHQYIAIQALRALPANITTTSIPSPPSGQSTFALIPSGQLGLNENQLPGQPVRSGPSIINATTSGSAADINSGSGTVINGGSAVSGENWSQTLQRELANRYFTSVMCSWQATGGSIPNLLPRLSDAELNVTQSITNDGNMFEKFSNTNVDSAGRGGEYTVQIGFGWTNGALLWFASNYGPVLASPQCPNLLETPVATGATTSSNSSGAIGRLNQPEFFSSIGLFVILVAGFLLLQL